MQIDDSFTHPWPEEVEEAARLFRQGPLVECPPLFFARKESHPVCTCLDGSLLECVVAADLTAPYGIVTSQSCDVAEQGKPKKPWIQIAPAFLLEEESDGQLRQIQRGEIGYLYPLAPQGLDEGMWVADLRIELPLEKSWLVNRRPIAAFSGEVEARDFAIHIGRMRSRAALGNEMADVVVGSLRAAIRKVGGYSRRGDRFSAVRDMWLRLIGSWESPSGATLYVACDDAPAADITAFFDGWFNATWEASYRVGCALQGNQYLNLRTMPAVDYLDLTSGMMRLDFDHLS